MSKTQTKQKINTLETTEANKPVELVIQLSNTLKNTDEEIKSLRKKIRDLSSEKYEDGILIKGLVNRVKELEKLKTDYEKLLKDMGAKEETIKNANDELNNICNTASTTLRNFKTTDKEILNEFSTEELEEMNKRALKRLDNLLKNV
jgi:DNA repair ATPase RecN